MPTCPITRLPECHNPISVWFGLFMPILTLFWLNLGGWCTKLAFLENKPVITNIFSNLFSAIDLYIMIALANIQTLTTVKPAPAEAVNCCAMSVYSLLVGCKTTTLRFPVISVHSGGGSNEPSIQRSIIHYINIKW